LNEIFEKSQFKNWHLYEMESPKKKVRFVKYYFLIGFALNLIIAIIVFYCLNS